MITKIEKIRPGRYVSEDRRYLIQEIEGDWHITGYMCGTPRFSGTIICRTLRDAKAYLGDL